LFDYDWNQTVHFFVHIYNLTIIRHNFRIFLLFSRI
jgi:hypothetical protein